MGKYMPTANFGTGRKRKCVVSLVDLTPLFELPLACSLEQTSSYVYVDWFNLHVILSTSRV